ncbi:MAG TPA: hypothetical protein VHJ17_19405 [Thermomonospora sp.]|nr:hypothetical protein [Thermomonospora sp.]
MGDSGEQDPAVANFVAALGDLYRLCGAPSYRSLVKVSGRLEELYPEFVQDRTLPMLSITGISETLAGRRTRLPAPEWVVFVLSCRRRAYEIGVFVEDPGPDVLIGWITKWREAKVADRRSTTGAQGRLPSS